MVRWLSLHQIRKVQHYQSLMSSTNMTKYILAFIGAVVIAGAIYGAYQYPKAVISLGSTTLGGTTSTAHFYSVAANLATVGANATTSSVYNSSANDYYITSAKVGCEGIGSSKTVNTGAGLSALTLTIAISSTAAPVAFNPLAGSTFNGGA